MRYQPKRRRTRRQPNWLPAVVLSAAVIAVIAGIWIWMANRKEPENPNEVPSYVTEALLTVNEYSRPGTALEEVNGVVIHYVGNPGTTAEANRNYFESLSGGEEGIYASAHFIVGLEGEVVQCIPLTEMAYASNTRNNDTIAIEVCHSDETGRFSPVTGEKLVELTAWLCERFRLKPEDVIRHYDVSGKICPKYYVEHEEAWQAFLDQVALRQKQGFEEPN